MKPHFTEAPLDILHGMVRIREMTARNADSQASGWHKFIQLAQAKGYRVDASDIPTPALDELKRLTERAKTDRSAVLELRHKRLALLREARLERHAVARAQALTAWAQGPTQEEERLANESRLAAERRQQLINQRAQEILAQNQAKALEAAKKQAAKEIG